MLSALDILSLPDNESLKCFRVVLYSDQKAFWFDCFAENAEHAKEQALNTNPDDLIEAVFEIDPDVYHAR